MAAVPPAAVPFALMPAQAFGNALIDMRDRGGIALYRSNTRSLYTDPASLFEGKGETLMGFLTLMAQRIREANWEGIFNIPMVIGAAVPDLRPFVTTHGMHDLEKCVQFATPIVAAGDRGTQDNFMAVTAITSSLTADFMTRILISRAQYTIGEDASAICLLKVIIRESHIDSNASTRIAREKLSSLDVHMKNQGNDVVKFNVFVQTQLNILHSRGETTLDLLSNLFKGYQAVPNKAFVKYIGELAIKHDDGEVQYTTEQLMSRAAHRYKVMLEDKLWDSPDNDQARILALQAKINHLESSMKGNKAGSPAGHNADGNAGARRQGARFKPEPWMMKKPSDEDVKNEVSVKEGGREYWWCVHHERYVQHKGSKCNLGTNPQKGPATEPKGNADNNDKVLTISKALTSIVERE
jgi:hypothetical protein